MKLLLVVLQVLFLAPVFVRLAKHTEGRADEGFLAEIRAGARQPILVLHGTALVLMWAGLVFALLTGRVARALTVRGALGAAIVLVATLLMCWSLVALRSWRLLPRVGPEHQLCTTGPYALVRHPMYLAIDLLGLGSAVWAPTAPVIVAAVALVVGGDLRARAEEKVLLEYFGDRYRDYMKQARRTIPGVY